MRVIYPSFFNLIYRRNSISIFGTDKNRIKHKRAEEEEGSCLLNAHRNDVRVPIFLSLSPFLDL